MKEIIVYSSKQNRKKVDPQDGITAKSSSSQKRRNRLQEKIRNCNERHSIRLQKKLDAAKKRLKQQHRLASRLAKKAHRTESRAKARAKHYQKENQPSTTKATIILFGEDNKLVAASLIHAAA